MNITRRGFLKGLAAAALLGAQWRLAPAILEEREAESKVIEACKLDETFVRQFEDELKRQFEAQMGCLFSGVHRRGAGIGSSRLRYS